MSDPGLVRDLVQRAGGAWVTCAGGSMEPTIARGARMRVAAARSVHAGDVILFEASDRLVAHRVVARLPAPGGAVLVHAGDAPAAQAGFVREQRVIGRVLSARRPRPLAARVAQTARALLRRLML